MDFQRSKLSVVDQLCHMYVDQAFTCHYNSLGEASIRPTHVC